jgi:hypothetical protein
MTDGNEMKRDIYADGRLGTIVESKEFYVCWWLRLSCSFRSPIYLEMLFIYKREVQEKCYQYDPVYSVKKRNGQGMLGSKGARLGKGALYGAVESTAAWT